MNVSTSIKSFTIRDGNQFLYYCGEKSCYNNSVTYTVKISEFFKDYFDVFSSWLIINILTVMSFITDFISLLWLQYIYVHFSFTDWYFFEITKDIVSDFP